MPRLPFILLCAALHWRPASAEVERTAFIQLAASVLKIEALRTQGGFALGSGVVVGPEQIVTNCHVTRDAREIHVLRGGVRWRVQAQSSDPEHDLCLLRAPGLVAEPVELGSTERLAPGQSVSAIGYTGGIGIQNSPGTVLALHRLDGGRVIQSSNWFSSGASGGGLFDDDLRLVGILTFRLRGGVAHYYAAPIEWMQPLLADKSRERGVAPLAAGDLAYWQRPAERQPWFLRAATLEHQQQWPELQLLAAEWARADATDPQPWYLLGLALAQQARPAEARSALECSLAIDPRFPPASTQLAQLETTQPAPAASAAPAAPAAQPTMTMTLALCSAGPR
jgi:serine protease Do